VGGWKPVPASLTACLFPVRRTGVGETPVMVGAEVIVRPLDRVTEPPPGLLTMTSSGPSVALPVTSTLMVICELLLTGMLTTEISVAVTPPRWKLTVAPGPKLMPVSTIVKSSAPRPTVVLETLESDGVVDCATAVMLLTAALVTPGPDTEVDCVPGTALDGTMTDISEISTIADPLDDDVCTRNENWVLPGSSRGASGPLCTSWRPCPTIVVTAGSAANVIPDGSPITMRPVVWSEPPTVSASRMSPMG